MDRGRILAGDHSIEPCTIRRCLEKGCRVVSGWAIWIYPETGSRVVGKLKRFRAALMNGVFPETRGGSAGPPQNSRLMQGGDAGDGCHHHAGEQLHGSDIALVEGTGGG
jgi:hypothetical protein